MNQNTLQKEYTFKGIGLHTGKYAHLTLCPAPENTGIRFLRTDLGDGAQIDALAENVSNTARSTTISAGAAKAVTVEHLLSALTGLGVDNALVKLDNDEVPILDGSARRYVEAILADGLRPQAAERRFLELDREIEVRDEQSGAWIRITPADKPSFALTTPVSCTATSNGSTSTPASSASRRPAGSPATTTPPRSPPAAPSSSSTTSCPSPASA